MEFKHMMFLIVAAIIAMFFITEKNLDYNEFVEFVRTTQPHKKKKAVQIDPKASRKTYGGVFAVGNCVRLDEVDYFKIVSEDEESYTHVLCKFGGKCMTTPVQEARTDFEISYSESDIVLCPMEEE